MSDITLRSTKGALLTNQEVDDNFSALNSDKYEALDNIVSTDLEITGKVSYSFASVTAAGTDRLTATALSATYNIVTTASANQGVRLPEIASGDSGTNLIIVNNTAFDVAVYPGVGSSIDDLSLMAGLQLKSGVTVTLVAESDTQWHSFFTGLIQVYNSSGVRLA